MSTSKHRRGGYERVVNDAPIIGDDVDITNEQNKVMIETKAFKKKIKTMRVHRNRIKHAHEFLDKIFNEYFILGTRELSSEELQDMSK